MNEVQFKSNLRLIKHKTCKIFKINQFASHAANNLYKEMKEKIVVQIFCKNMFPPNNLSEHFHFHITN